MNNYPVGAENDKNAPFNKEESLQGNEIGLFEYLENLEMPYEVRSELKKFEENNKKAFTEIMRLINIEGYCSRENLFKLLKLISEPQIFIEE